MSEEVRFIPPVDSPALPPVTSIMPVANKLPVIRLRNTVILPYTVITLPLNDEINLAIEASKQNDRKVLVAIYSPSNDDLDEDIDDLDEMSDEQTALATLDDPQDLVSIATVAKIEQTGRLPGGINGVVVRGLQRAEISDVELQEGLAFAQYRIIDETFPNDETFERLKLEVRAAIDAVLEMRGDIPQEIRNFVRNIEDPRQLADNTGYSPDYSLRERITLLTTVDVGERLRFVRNAYQKQYTLLEVQQRLRQEVEDGTAKQQREFYLRQQMRAIQKELGEDVDEASEIEELRERLAKANLPEEARKEADREISRLQRISNASPEHQIIRTYLEWLADLPWDKPSSAEIDIAHTRAVLDGDHYGLTKVKERILEYLAVRRRRQMQPATAGERSREPILALIGPPGVGKTSLGQSIAKALGRNFVRMSLGGVRDEAELRGFRRTYIGSAPGRIIQELRRAGSSDPVILLDEIDKLGNDFRGDPASALLEVLDPEQNSTFTDHYLNVAFDLSKVFFIATANTLETIPGPLRDRLEIIELSSYIEDEKMEIAKRHLAPKQMRTNALSEHDVIVSDESLQYLIQSYTRESGVRNLERQIGAVLRKIARTLEEHPHHPRPIIVDRTWVQQALGQPKFFNEDRERFTQSGISTGLVWTAVGGDIVYVEAALMQGAKELRITGQLGDVMRESAEAALTCVRTRAGQLGIPETFFDGRALHIHVPGGAVPKDGPSAGITMAAAIASAATGRMVRHDVAMTGEITLRGRVLPVGGIREKVLGAFRAGITNIVIPRRNMVDIDEVPADVRSQLHVTPVDTIDDVLNAVLLPLPHTQPSQQSWVTA
jgi:ATP-dependent Lon protease